MDISNNLTSIRPISNTAQAVHWEVGFVVLLNTNLSVATTSGCVRLCRARYHGPDLKLADLLHTALKVSKNRQLSNVQIDKLIKKLIRLRGTRIIFEKSFLPGCGNV